jgi:hypothetical protein
MNILQHLPESKHGPVLVTLNPPFPPDPLKTLGRWTYTHPMMTAESVSSQPLLPSIQNRRHISYAGAWTKYGFHEDGFTSAMRLVTAPPFSVKPPFPFMPAHRAVEKKDMVEETLSAVLGSMQMVLLNAEPVWQWVVVLAVVVLDVVRKLAEALRLEPVVNEVERLRVCWEGSEESRKRR